MQVDSWTCSSDVMCDLMFDGVVVVAGLCHYWEFSQDSLNACFRAGGRREGLGDELCAVMHDALNVQLYECIGEALVPHVNQQVVGSEKISFEDGLLDICNGEEPPKCPMKSQVKCKRLIAEGRNRDAIEGLQAEEVLSVHLLRTGRWYHTDLHTCVDEKLKISGTIRNVKYTHM